MDSATVRPADGSARPATGFLVKQEDLKAGDVLLTRSAGVQAAAIALATGGIYSHAAIWLPLRIADFPPELVLVESEGSGVGETYLPSGLYQVEEGSRCCLGTFVVGVEQASVFRHPALAALPPAELERAAEQLKTDEFYLAYSKLERVAGAISQFPSLRGHAARGLRLIDWNKKNLVPGTFCSELVSTYFQLLNVPLFDVDRSPETVSPNDLANGSRLQEEEGLLVPVSELAHVEYHTIGADLRKQNLPMMVRSRSGAIRGTELSEQIVAAMNRQMSISSEKLKDQISLRKHEISQRVKLSVQIGDHAAVERFEDLLASAEVGEAIAIEHLRLRQLTDPPLETKLWLAVCSCLMLMVIEILNKTQRDLVRVSALQDIRVTRLLRSEPGRSLRTRLAQRKVRRGWLRLWKNEFAGRSKEADKTDLANLLENPEVRMALEEILDDISARLIATTPTADVDHPSP